MSDRIERLLQGVDIDAETGLEIGPLDKPVVPKRAGREIYYADYADRETLRAKSATDPSVDVEAIPHIDYLIADLPVKLDRTFDYIIASHVIEHTPDLIGWLRTLLGWLAPGGRVILAVPDKRYCFDYLRAPSTVGALIEAYLEGRRRPGFSAVYDAMSMAANLDLARAWREDPYRGPSNPIFSPEVAFATAKRVAESDEHIDCHCWVFTHSSFLQAMAEISAHGVAPVHIVREAAPVSLSNEFHVVLAQSIKD
jgi:SAM-dependent methyltransferase